jgi:hypothetical protein
LEDAQVRTSFKQAGVERTAANDPAVAVDAVSFALIAMVSTLAAVTLPPVKAPDF